MRDTEIFGIKPTKGLVKTGHKLITFDAVQRCQLEDCPIHNDCPYTKGGRCTVVIKYLDAIMKGIIDDIDDKMTQGLLNKISLHLMPLFHQLIKFQIHAYSIDSVAFTTGRGVIKMHPIFKAIRETIRAIESTQRSMGMDLEFTYAMEKTMGKLGRMKNARPDDHGDPDYFKRWQTQTADDIFPEGKAQGARLRRRR